MLVVLFSDRLTALRCSICSGTKGHSSHVLLTWWHHGAGMSLVASLQEGSRSDARSSLNVCWIRSTGCTKFAIGVNVSMNVSVLAL